MVTGSTGSETYQRLKAYLTYAFTTIGSPHIWNGDEMGMWGSDDPNCRKPLMWKELKFEDEYRNNFQPGKKTFDKVQFNAPLFDFYKKLIQIRKSNPVLSSGKLNFLVSEGKKLAYARTDGKDEIVVLFNLSNRKDTFQIKEGSYVDLLTNKTVKAGSVQLNPLSATILKKRN